MVHQDIHRKHFSIPITEVHYAIFGGGEYWWKPVYSFVIHVCHYSPKWLSLEDDVYTLAFDPMP